MVGSYEKEARETALDMALQLQKERFADDNVVSSAVVIADAVVFYRFLTRIPG
jgi:hypothetical protein